MKKKADTSLLPLTIILLLSSVICCLIGGVTRSLYPYSMSSSLTEGIVGIGMAGAMFFIGILLLFGASKHSKTMELNKKIPTILVGILSTVLGLGVAFIAILQMLGLVSK